MMNKQSNKNIPLYTDTSSMMRHVENTKYYPDEDFTFSEYLSSLSDNLTKNLNITADHSDEDFDQIRSFDLDSSKKSMLSSTPTSYMDVELDDLSYGTIENMDNSAQDDTKRYTVNPQYLGNELEQMRIFDMSNMRIKISKKHCNNLSYNRPIIFNEDYVNIFSKGLPHDSEGLVNKNGMMKLLSALNAQDNDKLSRVKLAGDLKLVNPSASWSYDIIGACNNTYYYTPPPNLSSHYIASEMLELYCMSLTRDIKFNNYHTSAAIDDCCSYLKLLKKYSQVNGDITSYNIFRGPMYGDLQGPYISQFLYRDIKIGGYPHKQKYTTDLEGHDFMKTWDTAISAQNGNILETSAPIRIIPRYIITGRDLACYVHNSDPYEAFLNTCNILMDLKVPMNSGIVKAMNSNENYRINFGKEDIQSILGLVGRNASLAAFYVKWNTLFLRPEALGIEVERIYRKTHNKYCISQELLKNPVLKAIHSSNGNVLLSQVYPEGAPLHPSMPSGCATTAGACITILKFFFELNYELDVYEPDNEGNGLINIGKKTTIEDELNKLACNMSIGRAWAGINYHMDSIKGLKLGEKVAISCLHDIIQRYPCDLSVSFIRFNGSVVTIHK